MPKIKSKEKTFPSLNQTGERSSLDLNLGYLWKNVDHVRRGARRKIRHGVQGALNKASLLLLRSSSSWKHESSQAQARPEATSQVKHKQQPRTRAQASQAHG